MKKISLAAIFLFLFCVVSPAQETARTSTDEQVLREILAELKQLRSTLARTTANQIRFQTAFEQYKMQQARVDSMNRELEAVKNQLANNSSFRVTQEEMNKANEERLAEATDPRVRQTLERAQQMYKRNLEAQEQRDKRTRDRQSALEIQIPAEQAKLDQLSGELERIKQDINALISQ